MCLHLPSLFLNLHCLAHTRVQMRVSEFRLETQEKEKLLHLNARKSKDGLGFGSVGVAALPLGLWSCSRTMAGGRGNSSEWFTLRLCWERDADGVSQAETSQNPQREGENPKAAPRARLPQAQQMGACVARSRLRTPFYHLC